MMSGDKCVLAYSGGLDTSAMIPYLRENHGVEVVAVLIDVGRAQELEALRRRALDAGAEEAIVIDAKEEFLSDFVLPALKAKALYEEKYPLVSALSRPLIAKKLVEVARQQGASTVAHGCTAKGNDQVRFDVSIRCQEPDMTILGPAREWGMTRGEILDYVAARGIDVPLTRKNPFSIDENLWGRTIECGELEDPWTEPPAEAYQVTVSIDEAPDEPQEVVINFKKGVPVGMDDQGMDSVALINRVDEIGGAHGFGRVDMIENRLIGVKSREIYEVPGALTLITAHKALEDLCLEREVLHYKLGVEQKWAELVYNGMWFSPLKEALDGFIDTTQQLVSGDVRLRFFKGSCVTVGRRSPYSLYDYNLATYDAADT